jgi:hypothetical protein
MIKSFPLFIFFLLQVNLFPKVNHYQFISETEIVFRQNYLGSSVTDSSLNRYAHFPKDSVKVVSDTLKNKNASPHSDSLALLSGTKKIEIDTVIPVYQSPVSNNSIILGSDHLRKNDYRYTTDYLKQFDYTFLAETGNLGFPDQLFLYGLPIYQTNYLKDGISQNDIPAVFFDVNYLQSESVDSIEIIPAPRGFLYGGYNKSASVNFISKDFISVNPYTRIKYYQGVFGEAMLDGIFNSALYNRLFGFLDITNRKLDKRFINSDLSSWQVTAKLRYLLSNNYNITGSYNYNKIYKGLNGGVNLDSLILPNDLYDEIKAPVINNLTNMDITQHTFDLRLLAKPFQGSSSDFNIYYKFDGQNLSSINDDPNNFKKSNNKLYGALFNQKYNEDFYNINLIGTYEHSENRFNVSPPLQNSINLYQYKLNLFSLSGIAGIHISDKIKTSLFYKYSSINNDIPGFFRTNKTSQGVGLDLNISTSDDLSFYLGGSILKDYYSPKFLGNGEISITFSPDNLYLKLSLFSRNNTSQNYSNLNPLNVPYSLLSNLQPYTLSMDNPHVIGISGNLTYKFWIMSIENNTTYYTGSYVKDSLKYTGLLGIPEIYSRSGIYVSDSLFSSNLNLKGGFVFTVYGKIKYLTAAGSIFEITPSYKLDFTLAGRIRNAATVYFTWENLLDSKYFLVPYYPNLGRNIRFGIAWDLFN